MERIGVFLCLVVLGIIFSVLVQQDENPERNYVQLSHFEGGEGQTSRPMLNRAGDGVAPRQAARSRRSFLAGLVSWCNSFVCTKDEGY